ncbi:unnamed protein product [Mesocestoides corti]|uniref:SAGA-associated factor 11 n=2 Tax=Mesocestoides corti TaxID=53468 RepID=A0A0R3UIP7_MESCO|nr:unnamed protein product [Mesocestoides corti]
MGVDVNVLNNVFTEIEAQSLQFWMSTKYYLLLEYKAKTIVPAPFGVIQVVLEVVAYLMTLCVDAMRRRESPFGSLHVKEAIAALYEGESSDEEDDDDDDDLELSVTELQYWAAHQVLQREAVDETNRLDSICKMVENVHKTLVADGSGSELKAEDKGDLVARETTELSRTDSNQHVPIGKSSIEVAERRTMTSSFMMLSENSILHGIVDELIDACIMDDVLCLHRAIKLGYSHLILADCDDAEGGESDSAQLHSTRSETVNKFSACCRCVKCHCKVAATRYASHLSNCMGLGRNSSRRANKRIAEQQRLEDSDDVDDAYYLDLSPSSSSGPKSEHPSISYSKSHSSNYLHRVSTHNHNSSKPGLKPPGLSKSSNGRNMNSLQGDSAFEKTDSFDSISFSFDDEESNSSESNRRSAVTHVKRHTKGHI